MKNRSPICDIKGPTPRHGQKYTKYEMCSLSIMMLICNKTRRQYLKLN